MGTVGRTERIVYIKIAKFRERLRKRGIVRFFLRLKADVLEQGDIAALHMIDDFFWHVPNRVLTEYDGLMDKRVQIIANRTKRIFFHTLSFRPAKVRHQNRFRTVAGLKERDRKSTRLNSSHRTISYAVFCLKKKKQTITRS